MLMEPLVQDPKRANLMHPLLSKIDPKKCFLELVDYSRDKDGKPGTLLQHQFIAELIWICILFLFG